MEYISFPSIIRVYIYQIWTIWGCSSLSQLLIRPKSKISWVPNPMCEGLAFCMVVWAQFVSWNHSRMFYVFHFFPPPHIVDNNLFFFLLTSTVKVDSVYNNFLFLSLVWARIYKIWALKLLKSSLNFDYLEFCISFDLDLKGHGFQLIMSIKCELFYM